MFFVKKNINEMIIIEFWLVMKNYVCIFCSLFLLIFLSSCSKEPTQQVIEIKYSCTEAEWLNALKVAKEHSESSKLRENISYCDDSESISKEAKSKFIKDANIIDAKSIFNALKLNASEVESNDIDWAITLANNNADLFDVALINKAKSIVSERNIQLHKEIELAKKESRSLPSSQSEQDGKECLQSIGIDPNDGQHKISPSELDAFASCIAKRGY